MKKSKSVVGFLVVILLGLSIGVVYASVSGVSLSISGTAKSKVADFDVRFTDAKEGNKEGNATVTAGIDLQDPTKANFEITDLQYAGDYVVIEYTITNMSSYLYAVINNISVSVSDNDGNQFKDINNSDFSITATLEGNKSTLKAGESVLLLVKVTAWDNFDEEVIRNVEISFDASPKQPSNLIIASPDEKGI